MQLLSYHQCTAQVTITAKWIRLHCELYGQPLCRAVCSGPSAGHASAAYATAKLPSTQCTSEIHCKVNKIALRTMWVALVQGCVFKPLCRTCVCSLCNCLVTINALHKWQSLQSEYDCTANYVGGPCTGLCVQALLQGMHLQFMPTQLLSYHQRTAQVRFTAKWIRLQKSDSFLKGFVTGSHIEGHCVSAN